ncbi:MAG: FixH family protein [Woeseiaceae bacterium]|nr:FixH family protein [Woeseiaceae bacterium]MDX2609063.1 FixH family protein [Woeseiaceae bacterium]
MSEQDSKPWYRYFWPWFIIGLLASSVSASLYSVYLAVSTAEPVLTETHERQ